MRFLIKIPIPATAENTVAGDFDETLKQLFLKIGAQAAYSKTEEGRRVDYVLIDIEDVTRITALAEPIFHLLQVRPEFLPEIAPDKFGY